MIVIVGAVVSTVTALLVFVAAALFAVSYTLFAGNVNVTVPFDHAFHVYVNVNVLLVALHPTLALLNITYALLNVISLALNAFVLIHTPSVHVNTTVHAVPLLTYAALGVHHVHTGTVLSILLTVILQLHVFHALSCTYIVLLPFALNVHVVRLVVILLYHVQLYLSLFVSVTVAVNVTFPFVLYLTLLLTVS